jgi:hypothetical protein
LVSNVPNVFPPPRRDGVTPVKMQEARKKEAALLTACEKGDEEAVHRLLAAGVDLEAQDHVRTTH